MLIGNKVFPYPLLKSGNNNPDYNNTQFYFDFDRENDVPITINGMLVLKNIHFVLSNPELKKLYDEGFIKVLCEVDCSNTVYRECFEIFEAPMNKEIAISNFANVVTVSAYAIAVKEINDYVSSDFVSDYEGYSFHFNPWNIVAADDGIKFRVDIDESNDNKIASIFTIVRKEDAADIVTYNNESNKIVIYLNPEGYKIYDSMKNHSMYNNLFFANLVIPVLTSCLQEIKSTYKEVESLDEICDDKPWFVSVMKRYSYVKGKKLDSEEFASMNSFEFAQLLMNESTEKCLKDYFELTMNGEEAAEDE